VTAARIPTLEVAAQTHLGRPAEPDLDVFLVRRDLGLAVLADGVAGWPAGDVAAQIAVEAVERCLTVREAGVGVAPPRSALEAHARLFDAVQYANLCVSNARSTHERHRGMGTTIVAVLACGPVACIAHVGDSRAYHVVDGRCEQLTRDHTVAGALRAANIPPEFVFPLMGDDTQKRTLGTVPIVVVSGRIVRMQAGEALLLTSDAFNHLAPDPIGACFSPARSASATLEQLFARATETGGRENRTAIALLWRP